MKLFYAPGACSLGIHIILEEIGKPFELHKLDVRVSNDQFKPPMSELNPKAKVPTLLRDNGRVITEFPVIAHWLAAKSPEAGLLPQDEEEALVVAEVMDYCTATVHMQGFTRLFRPGNFSPSESEHDAVKARGREIVAKGFAILAQEIGGKDWIAGPYSVADSALFYLEFWAARRMNVPMPPALAAHFDRMLARPAVQRAMAQEGIA